MKTFLPPLLLLSFAALSAAQDLRPLAAALNHYETASKAIEACHLDEARTASQSGLQALAAAPSPATGDITAAAQGTLQTNLRKQLDDVNRLRASIQLHQPEVKRLLKVGQLASARRIWESYSGPPCDPGLGAELEKREKTAASLEKLGDAESDPRSRLKLYQAAEKSDAESPSLSAKRQSAQLRVNKLPCGACKTTGRIVKHLVIWGGVAGAAYVTYHQLDQRGLIPRR